MQISLKFHDKLKLMDVNHVAKLANIPVNTSEVEKYSSQFAETLKVIGVLSELETSTVTETAQVTGLENVFREDQVDDSRILSQNQALSQAKQVHNGYIVVPQLIENA